MKSSIFLYGPPGVGKSTLAVHLAAALDQPCIDLDAEIETRTGTPIPQIFAAGGERGFRQLERETLLAQLESAPAVFALGGGTLLDPQNRQAVEGHGQVVCLEGSFELLAQRLEASEAVRPLVAADLSRDLEALLSQRAGHYASFTLRRAVDGQSPTEIAWGIQKLLGRYHVRGMGRGYPVTVAERGLSHLDSWINQQALAANVCVVTDSNVGPHYAHRVVETIQDHGGEVVVHTILPGEQHKNLSTIQQLWAAFLAAGLDRRSCVIALGGGVVGDLAGFAAATYMRGIHWINLPTSLLAMVDAAVGGKTGFDLPQGKNLVGAFHAPQQVLADPDALTTLPEEEMRRGMAEVVKHGVIGSPELYALCANGLPGSPQDLSRLISEAVSVKVKVIQEDPYESGRRAALNYGHTVGHALEALSDFRMPHGEAVAIGMVCEARLAAAIGLAELSLPESISETLERLALPSTVPSHMTSRQILKAMQTDKKTAGGQIRFALPAAIGLVEVGVVVDNLEEVFPMILKDKQ